MAHGNRPCSLENDRREANQPLHFEPGSRLEYSHTNYSISGSRDQTEVRVTSVSIRCFVFVRHLRVTRGHAAFWNAFVGKHRREVSDAILARRRCRRRARAGGDHDAADRRRRRNRPATLYKYFADIQAILTAWHDRVISGHLDHLVAIRDSGGPEQRMPIVPRRTLYSCTGSAATTARSLWHTVHRGVATSNATYHKIRRHHRMFDRNCLGRRVRCDTGTDELAVYCVHALAAARSLPSRPPSSGRSRSR